MVAVGHRACGRVVAGQEATAPQHTRVLVQGLNDVLMYAHTVLSLMHRHMPPMSGSCDDCMLTVRVRGAWVGRRRRAWPGA
jgi:hypothetical protein